MPSGTSSPRVGKVRSNVRERQTSKAPSKVGEIPQLDSAKGAWQDQTRISSTGRARPGCHPGAQLAHSRSYSAVPMSAPEGTSDVGLGTRICVRPEKRNPPWPAGRMKASVKNVRARLAGTKSDIERIWNFDIHSHILSASQDRYKPLGGARCANGFWRRSEIGTSSASGSLSWSAVFPLRRGKLRS
jgi:hypothetical protein